MDGLRAYSMRQSKADYDKRSATENWPPFPVEFSMLHVYGSLSALHRELHNASKLYLLRRIWTEASTILRVVKVTSSSCDTERDKKTRPEWRLQDFNEGLLGCFKKKKKNIYKWTYES